VGVGPQGPIAIRVYPVPPSAPFHRRRANTRPPLPDACVVWDTETRVDVTQRLSFGSYRFIEDGDCLTERLFCADDLTTTERDVLTRYVATHAAEVAESGLEKLSLFSRSEFLRAFYRLVYKGRVLLIGFNQPFDLSRVAHDQAQARGKFTGGFSLGLWSYRDLEGQERRHQQRPRISIKHIDSRRALIGFTARKKTDEEDLIPEDSETGEARKGYKFRGHFLDLRTLAFALTDRGHTLESACEAFAVEHPKKSTSHHGTVTPDYIDYNRRDVLATWELAVKMLEEYDRHPIALPVTQAFSPASIGKSYLRAMGIPPVLERQPDFPTAFLGHAQTAFFGGRTSAHIRRVAVPVVYSDFLSMYPTVNSLMGLWRFVTARKVRVVKHCEAEITELLHECQKNPDEWFRPERWARLSAFVCVIPDGDVLPVRGKFGVGASDWQVALNHLHAREAPNDRLWFALPDVVASVILTGRVPQVVDAFRIEPSGVLKSLRPVKLRGTIEVDPSRQDFFRVVIEERKRLAKRSDLSDLERKRLDKALKVLANATSYGIYAEMQRRESSRAETVQCQGIDEEPFTCRVAHADKPGEYCFPPVASLITSAARLMLALLERAVTSEGGTYAMEDTDSMAIVSTEKGGLVPCPGGRERTADGHDAVRALSWSQVNRIAERFRSLSPYDQEAIEGSVLEVEKDNFDPITGDQRQLWCFAVSAKRYALFLRSADGDVVLLKAPTAPDKEGRRREFLEGLANNEDDRWSEHGLGHLLNPTDPEANDRDWIAQVWLNIIRKNFGLSTHAIGFESLPAVGQVSISSPPLLRPFKQMNRRKHYQHQVKPFNFLSTCHVRPFGRPYGSTPERFQLVAPYESDSRRWLKMDWIDRYSSQTYRIGTTGDHGDRRTARVKSYGDVIEEYEYHPESKCADASGQASGKQTLGLLQRRHVRIDSINAIGKESNSLEEVEAGLVHDEQNVYTEYTDRRRDYWSREVVPALWRISLKAWDRESEGKSRRILIDARLGRRLPHRRHRELLIEIARRHGLL